MKTNTKEATSTVASTYLVLAFICTAVQFLLHQFLLLVDQTVFACEINGDSAPNVFLSNTGENVAGERYVLLGLSLVLFKS